MRLFESVPPPATFAACSGCDVCALSCPVWQQTRDLRLTPKGRAMALQGGATAADIAESLAACVMCGSCAPACPERIDLVGMTLALRGQLGPDSSLAPLAAGFEAPREKKTSVAAGKTVLLAEERLLANSALLNAAIIRLGGPSHVVVADDAGRDIAAALEAGMDVDASRLEQFLLPLRSALRVVTTEGFLDAFLRKRLPRVPVRSLGESCLALEDTRRALAPDDLYVVDARAYHADFARLVRVYDALRQETGCDLNLDLQRFAIPTAATALNAHFASGPVRVGEQVKWLLEGRRPRRVVVENLEDGEAIRRERDVPVVHVAALRPS